MLALWIFLAIFSGAVMVLGGISALTTDNGRVALFRGAMSLLNVALFVNDLQHIIELS